MIDVSHIPAEIIASDRIVLWKVERRGDHLTKVPYRPRRPAVRAAVDAAATWGTFRIALAAVLDGRAAGLGIVLGDGLVGVDLDHCRVASALTDEALAIVRALDSYTEVSPSGTGVHVLVHGTLPPGRRKEGGIEMYCERRFFTITGAHVAGTPATIEERTAGLAALHSRIFGAPDPKCATSHTFAVNCRSATTIRDDGRLLERAHAAKNGARFAALWAGDTSRYPSRSEADLALCNFLAFWTDGDPVRIDALFRQSRLYRPKWDAARGGQTYGERTIATAVGGAR